MLKQWKYKENIKSNGIVDWFPCESTFNLSVLQVIIINTSNRNFSGFIKLRLFHDPLSPLHQLC